MPIYHDRQFSVKQLAELWEKTPKTVKKIINDAEKKKLPLELYVSIYVDKIDKNVAVSGTIWVNEKGNCRNCKKSYVKIGRWNQYCPICSKKLKYSSQIDRAIDEIKQY
jgi:hypothetical protein